MNVLSFKVRAGLAVSFNVGILAVLAMAVAHPAQGAGSTATGYSTKTGYLVTGTASDKWGAHGATPTVQQAATLTATKVLMNKGIQATGADYSVQHVTVNVSAANLIAMYTTPVQIIAAPGAGKVICVTKLAFTITRTSTAFTGGAAVIFQYDSTANGAGVQALDSTLASTVITGAAGTTTSVRNGAVLSDLSTTITNKGLFISNGTAVFAAGTGTAVVDVWYVIGPGGA